MENIQNKALYLLSAQGTVALNYYYILLLSFITCLGGIIITILQKKRLRVREVEERLKTTWTEGGRGWTYT